jgi:Copper type II ascorbate-dependent monooxygenase, C-terminal domain
VIINKSYAIGFVLLVGCGTDTPAGPELVDGFHIPAAPDNGLQIITPIVEDIQPGSDNEYCMWTDKILADVTDIRSTAGFQTEPPGHHTVLYYTTEIQPANTQRLCTDTDMASFRFLTGNGGEGELNNAPGNLVYRAPKGAQLVINAHYLNTSDQVLRGQSAINVNFAEPGIDYVPSGSTAFLDTNLHVPVGTSTFETTCTIDRTLKMWYLIPHMHRWGTHIQVDFIKSGGEPNRLFDTVWDESFTFHPPELRIDPATPMMFEPGDQLKVHCEYNNDTGRVLDFGFEMCVSYMQYVDDSGVGSVACDGGNWTDF